MPEATELGIMAIMFVGIITIIGVLIVAYVTADKG